MNESDALSIVQKFTNQRISEIYEIKNRGEVNKIFRIIADGKNYILRIDPNEADMNRFRKEQWCMEAASHQGILVPKVFVIGMHQDNQYMLMEYIEGISGDELEQVDFI